MGSSYGRRQAGVLNADIAANAPEDCRFTTFYRQAVFAYGRIVLQAYESAIPSLDIHSGHPQGHFDQEDDIGIVPLLP